MLSVLALALSQVSIDNLKFASLALFSLLFFALFLFSRDRAPFPELVSGF